MSVSAQLILLVFALTLGFAVWAASVLIDEHGRRSELLAAAGSERHGALTDHLENLAGRLRRFGPVAAFQARLRGAGLNWPALRTIVLVVLAMAAIYIGGYSFLGRAASILLMLGLPAIAWQWLNRRIAKRTEEFIAQLPELARVLANGTAAGLSMRRCLGIAARELSGPAGEEMVRIAGQVETGWAVEDALVNLAERMPSRELNVLVRTIVIQAHTGGKLTSALQDIAKSLDDRKELRREVKTVILGASTSGYAVFGIGIGAILLLNMIEPGLLDTMLSMLFGQIALLLAALFFAFGFVLMRLVSRIEV